jgi:RNA-directed DNA polymerase
MSLKTPEKVRKLQRALYVKAKEEPNYRFYLLYDKIYREDILEFAYRKCKANGGAPGVDGESFAAIEGYGRQRWLWELAEELREKRYRARAVRRQWIEKSGGGKRPLGIPTIRDRVVQMATVLVVGPIFEADLDPDQYGYRPRRSAQDAVRRVHGLLNRGYREVVDGDLKGYFDTIPHRELLQCVARRISDRQLLRLVKMWLKTPVREDPRGSDEGKPGGRKQGTPQGSPLSPLLANVYFRRLLVSWKRQGLERQLQAHIVNYADDFVICCRKKAEEALQVVEAILQRMHVTLNAHKTRIARIPAGSFDFLGYTFGRCYAAQTGRPYIGTRVSQKAIISLCLAISEATQPRWLLLGEEDLVRMLNRKLNGWANYFQLGGVSKAYGAVDSHTRYRLRRWLRCKHQVRHQGKTRFPDEYLYDQLGLTRLERRTRDLPWAKA